MIAFWRYLTVFNALAALMAAGMLAATDDASLGLSLAANGSVFLVSLWFDLAPRGQA
ncbi:hypothetical protein HNR01_001748 [Methylorubrum rhodesianum]|uniref:hypothetical protein n=1 Tax=Methylorubrum rhodesianum TaxID=29427 RepID=UPI00161B41EA|nr:hypothetical protein [Methylorubrum rhodesianum]MBB5762128.1 hypothetical protein [Methylorubrum rhodesianum]